jgi:hypothetical protein
MQNVAARPASAVLACPVLYLQSHPDDINALAKSFNVNPVAGFLGRFEVNFNFDTKPFDIGTSNPSGDPGQQGGGGGAGPGVPGVDVTARTRTYKYSTNTHTVAYLRSTEAFPVNAQGQTGRPIQNTAGEPFDGETKEVITHVIGAEFYVAVSMDIVEKQMEYALKVNDADFFLFDEDLEPYPAGELRCNKFNGVAQYDQSGWFQKVEVEVEWNPDGWQREFRNRGTYSIISGSQGNPADPPVYKSQFDAAGNKMIVDLDIAGRKLAPGALPIYLSFPQYWDADFTDLFATT